MYKQINSIYTNILDKRILSCWLQYNTLIHMFTFATSLLTDHQLVQISWLSNKSAISTTQHESRWHRIQFDEIQYESNTRPTAACHVCMSGG